MHRPLGPRTRRLGKDIDLFANTSPSWPSAASHMESIMEEILSTFGQIDLVNGMYGKEHVFTSGSQQVQEAVRTYLIRVLTEEDVFRLGSFGKLAPEAHPGQVHHCILSGLRLCRHDTGPKLVANLKDIGMLDPDFPALDQPVPVPGTVSLTTLDRWGPVYRVFVDRLADTFFPTANTNCLVMSVADFGILGIRHFSDPGEVQVLLEELEDLLPEFTMMKKWQAEIKECATTLAESHLYIEVDVAAMMAVGSACLLPMGQLPGHIQSELSYAAYVKQKEKRDKNVYGAPIQGHHIHLLYKGLLQAIETVVPVGKIPMSEWELIRRILRMGVLFQMECSIWRQVHMKPRAGGKYLFFARRFRAAFWRFAKKVGIALLVAAPFLIRKCFLSLRRVLAQRASGLASP